MAFGIVVPAKVMYIVEVILFSFVLFPAFGRLVVIMKN